MRKKVIKKEMLKQNQNLKITSAIITIAVVIVLFLTGPANAVRLQLNILDKEVVRGTNINIMSAIEIESSELVDADYIELKLTGPTNIECKFLPNATIISECNGININILNLDEFGYGYGLMYKPQERYGYGYGFKPGFLKYNITLKTNSLKLGVYKTELLLVVGERTFNLQGDKINIKSPLKKLDNRCSIRAFDGTFNVDSKDFSNNRIKFYISSKNNEIKGDGSLSGQKGRERFSYRFKIDEVIENNESNLIFSVFGVYRVGRNGNEKNIPENAILNFDRINNKISVIGNKIKIKTMMMNFIEGCDSI